jgi:hypothetical protein
MNRYYKGILITLWAVALASLLVGGYVQSVILERHQHTSPSAAAPVQVTLKGKAFNISRQLKYVYEAANATTIAVFPLLVATYLLYRRQQKKSEPPL